MKYKIFTFNFYTFHFPLNIFSNLYYQCNGT